MIDQSYTIRLDQTISDHSKKKFTCPSCNKPKRFVRYYDFEKHEYLPEHFGRCDRQESCGYFNSPDKAYWALRKNNYDKEGISANSAFMNNENVNFHKPPSKTSKQKSGNNNKGQAPKHISANFALRNKIPFHYCQPTLSGSDQFSNTIERWFGKRAKDKIIKRFLIGTDSQWPQATIFWQVDTDMNLRAGKIMQYDHHLKRVKTGGSARINWVHSRLKKQQQLPENFQLEQCFFGEHQLATAGEHDQIVLTESAKNAILGWLWKPEYIWLSTEGVNGFKQEKCGELEGRTVYLLPDFSDQCRADWKGKALAMTRGLDIDFRMMQIGAHLNDGTDIADLILGNPQVRQRIMQINELVDPNLFGPLKESSQSIEEQYLKLLKFYSQDFEKAYDVLCQIRENGKDWSVHNSPQTIISIQ